MTPPRLSTLFKVAIIALLAAGLPNASTGQAVLLIIGIVIFAIAIAEP